MSTQQKAKFGDLWVGGEGGCVWKLHRRRERFVWERELINNLLAIINGFTRLTEED